MKVRDFLDILLDSCELSDDIVIVKGKEKDHDKFNSIRCEEIEWSTDRSVIYLFADFEDDNDACTDICPFKPFKDV